MKQCKSNKSNVLLFRVLYSLYVTDEKKYSWGILFYWCLHFAPETFILTTTYLTRIEEDTFRVTCD